MKTQHILFKILMIVLIQEASFAQITFQKTYGVTGFDQGVSLKQTADSGYIVLGYTGIGWKDSIDMLLVKTDINGDTLWTRTFGGSLNEYGYGVIETHEGGYLTTGATASFGAGGYDVYLNKFDHYGNLTWSKTIGDTADNWATSAIETGSGFVIFGTTRNYNTNGNIYVAKADFNGDTLWTKVLTGAFWAGGKLTSDNGFIIAATNYDSIESYNACLLKTDSACTIIWAKKYLGSGYDYGNYAEQTTDGGYIIAGSTNSFGASNFGAFLIKTDSTGDSLWTKIYNGQQYDFASKVHQTMDGGYILSGKSGNFSDYYLLKADSYGDTIWTRSGGTNFEGSTDIQVCNDGGFAFTYSGSAYDNLHLIKTDSLGNSGCAMSSAPFTISNASFQISNLSLGLTAINATVTNATTSMRSGSIVGTPCSVSNVSEHLLFDPVSIFPNPCNQWVTIQRTNSTGQIILFDITGKQILKQKTSDVETKINTQKVLPGFYLLNYAEGNKTVNFKVIKE